MIFLKGFVNYIGLQKTTMHPLRLRAYFAQQMLPRNLLFWLTTAPPGVRNLNLDEATP